jgi:integrase
VAELLRAIDSYQGFFATKCALRLAPLVFVRPGELRKAQWSEIDLDNVRTRGSGLYICSLFAAATIRLIVE